MKTTFSDFELGYDAGYRKYMKDNQNVDLNEDLEIEKVKVVKVQYNNEYFRNVLYTRLKKKHKLFDLNVVDRPVGFENAYPVGATMNTEDEDIVKKYYYVSKKDPSVYYVTYLGIEDGEPRYKLTVLGIKHLKNEIKTFKNLAKLVTYSINVEKVVDIVEDDDEEE